MQLWTSKFELFFVFCFYRMILCPVPVFFSEAISCTLAMFCVWNCNYAQLPELLAVYNYIFVVQGVLLWILIDHNSHDTQSRTQVCYIFPGLIMFIGSCLLVLSSLLPQTPVSDDTMEGYLRTFQNVLGYIYRVANYYLLVLEFFCYA
jgi:hypothetical protein